MLARTLRAFTRVIVPDGWSVELVVVDNGSSDDTGATVRTAVIPGMYVRYLYEPSAGKSRALNAALGVARGTALLFTDDDVEPADNWLELMAAPLIRGECSAVAGCIRLADELRRPWMNSLHLLWLADVPTPADDKHGLVGANMGIHRSVFLKIGVFDENLGPGISGFGEETLLWRQMRDAGMKILPVTGTHVIHRPDPVRLRRASWLAAARNFGETSAYLMHHWDYAELPFPHAARWWNLLKLHLRNPLRFLARADREGCPSWEMSYLVKISCCGAYLRQSLKPRNYPRRPTPENTLANPIPDGQSIMPSTPHV